MKENLKQTFDQATLRVEKPHLFVVDGEGNGLVLQTLKAGLNSAMEALVLEGADFKSPNKAGITPLMQTLLDGNTPAADFLKAQGAKMSRAQAQKMLAQVVKETSLTNDGDENGCLLTTRYEEARKIANRYKNEYTF